MQQSNLYIVVFSVIMTIVIGGLLSGISQVLKEPQRRSVELDTKKQILGAVIPASELARYSGQQILDLYDKRISSVVADFNGNLVESKNGEPVIAEYIDIARNFKMNPQNRLYPVFKFHGEGNQDAVEAYILPIYGNGLWDNIWGFVALDTDLNTIRGVRFDHAAETPGLGARITEAGLQARYQGKRIFDQAGNLVSVTMVKGENNPESALGPHRVDGMSGATITANGVNEMMRSYLGFYQNFFEKNVRNNQQMAILAE